MSVVVRQMVAPAQSYWRAGNPGRSRAGARLLTDAGTGIDQGSQVTETGSAKGADWFFFVSQISIATATGPTMASA